MINKKITYEWIFLIIQFELLKGCKYHRLARCLGVLQGEASRATGDDHYFTGSCISGGTSCDLVSIGLEGDPEWNLTS